MLLNNMDVDNQDSAKAYIVCEPKRLDEDVLLCKFVDERHDVLGGLDAFLNMGAHHRVGNPGSAAEIGKVIQQE